MMLLTRGEHGIQRLWLPTPWLNLMFWHGVNRCGRIVGWVWRDDVAIAADAAPVREEEEAAVAL